MSCSFLESPFKGSASNIELVGNSVDDKFLIVILLDISLSIFYELIVMVFKAMKYNERRLHILVQVNNKEFSRLYRHISVSVFFNQMKKQIPIGVISSAGIQSILIGDDFF